MAMSHPEAGKRQTIGLFTKSLVEVQRSSSSWEMMVDLAQENDANLLIVVGGMLRSPIGFEAQANILYEFVNSTNVDGLIVTGGLGHYVDLEGLQAFCAQFRPLPLVSLEVVLAGIPSIVPDFYAGISSLINHLVHDHGCRRIAFIRGPADSKTGEQRYRAYLDSLVQCGVPVDLDLVAPGTFFAPSGADAVRLLLDERQVVFDALVAANDEMAIDAMQLLQARGFRVPEDVAICGFDDLPIARSMVPQLTTVELPMQEEVRLATDLMLALLRGEPAPLQIDLQPKVIIRQSCGCRSSAMEQVEVPVTPLAMSPAPARRADDWRRGLDAERQPILEAMIRACGRHPAHAPIDLLAELIDAFAFDLGDAQAGRFLSALRRLTARSPLSGIDSSAWQSILSAHRRQMHPLLQDGEPLQRAENLWQRGRVFLAEMALNLEEQAQFTESQLQSILLSVGERLITTFDLASLMDGIVSELPRLHIPACYLVLYQNGDPLRGQSRLAVGYNEMGRLPLAPDGLLFATDQILPAGILPAHRSYSHLVFPLHFHEERMGFVIFEAGPRNGLIYQTLSLQLSTALRGALLVHEALQAREAALQAKALAEKADQLKTRLLANVTHELRTPLNVISGYSQMALLDPNPYHLELPPALRKDLENIHGSAEHLTRLISDLLDLSRAEIGELDLYPEPLAPKAFLEQAFYTMAESAEPSPDLVWRLELPPRLPMMQADPTRLRQIVLNLLSNARKFTERGEIVLGAEVSPPHLHLWVRDTGHGIPIERQEHVFEPFFTEGYGHRRPEGIGLGLTITRQLVALHGGSLSLESQPGRGSAFHIYLPLPNLGDRLLRTPITVDDRLRPAVLLISSVETPLVEVAALAQRAGWGICRVTSQLQLKQAVASLQPVALAWDLEHAMPGDWAIIQQVRTHPQLCQIPFLLFRKEASADETPSTRLTNILIKPLKAKTLADLIESVRPPTAGGTILIVDDDWQAREAYARLIAERFPGFPVKTAEDGREALEWLVQETPGMVILDLSMPEVDGFTVLETLRATPRTRMVPVIVLTGRLLSFEDIRRLDHSQVILQFKQVLPEEETIASVQRAFSGVELIAQPTSLLVKQALVYIQQHYAHALSRAEVAAAVGVSEDYLSRIFNKETGVSPWEYLNLFRVQQAKQLLRTSKREITWIAAQVGYDDPAYFSRVFQKIAGCSPREYRTALPNG